MQTVENAHPIVRVDERTRETMVNLYRKFMCRPECSPARAVADCMRVRHIALTRYEVALCAAYSFREIEQRYLSLRMGIEELLRQDVRIPKENLEQERLFA